MEIIPKLSELGCGVRNKYKIKKALGGNRLGQKPLLGTEIVHLKLLSAHQKGNMNVSLCVCVCVKERDCVEKRKKKKNTCPHKCWGSSSESQCHVYFSHPTFTSLLLSPSPPLCCQHITHAPLLPLLSISCLSLLITSCLLCGCGCFPSISLSLCPISLFCLFFMCLLFPHFTLFPTKQHCSFFWVLLLSNLAAFFSQLSFLINLLSHFLSVFSSSIMFFIYLSSFLQSGSVLFLFPLHLIFISFF